MFWTNTAIDVLLFFFVIVSVLMCLVVLMQKSKQEGLGAAFGGGMMTDIMGTGTSAFLVRATIWLAALFFIFSIALARLYAHRASLENKGSVLQQQLLNTPVPASTNAASAMAPAVAPATTTNAVATPAAMAPAAATSNAAAAPAAPAKPGAK
jgi:preprotein translocase subunit SecG